jgi:hypothetical protein
MDAVILEQYWKVLFSGFKVVSHNYYFSDCFHLNCWENGNCKSSLEKHPKKSKNQ